MANDVWRTPIIIEKIFPQIIWGADKDIFFTFDDGPSPETTPRILKYLDDNNIKACFFVRGDKAENNIELLREIKSCGHILGYHGFSHISWWFRTSSFYEHQINPHKSEIMSEFFTKSELFLRPPYGRFDLRVLKYTKKIDARLMLWRLAVGDWFKRKHWKQIASDISTFSLPGDIVLLHDSSFNGKHIIDILDYALENLDKRGIIPGEPGKISS